MAKAPGDRGYLQDARVYLSGPMDFVASRADEKRSGWRVRVGEFLRSLGATVLDPWSKPKVRGLQDYGREDETTIAVRENWTFDPTPDGARKRAECARTFWETMHIDLRMVDVSDLLVAYCPTNIYSVGTPHEIVVARQQHKPVLFVCPPVTFPALDRLRARLAQAKEAEAEQLLEQLVSDVPVKANPNGVPSLWYMPLIGGEKFFDGFGFDEYRDRFNWQVGPSDERERQHPPRKPLLPFLEQLNRKLPAKWDLRMGQFVQDDDWLLLDLDR